MFLFFIYTVYNKGLLYNRVDLTAVNVCFDYSALKILLQL